MEKKKINWKELCSNCAECCGPIPFSPKQLKGMARLTQADYRPLDTPQGIIPITKDLLCVFLDRKTKRCLIYKQRPDVCRKYGVIPELPCFKISGDEKVKKALEYLGL